MNYIHKIEESKQKVYNQSVATRILDLIDKLRLNSNENDERRWIWELLQNAKDVAFENQPVSIQIDFDMNHSESMIEFKHNGKPFSIDNITFLIEQVSTKERNSVDGVKPETIGKFGTGFLTTHLLSEKVDIEGIVKEPNLPYKSFNIQLDRSGRAIDEVISSVNESLRQLRLIDDKDEHREFDKDRLNTIFRYYLDKDGISIAHKGLEDLEVSLPFTLSFVPKIQSVSINSNITFRLLPEIIVEENIVEIYTIQKQNKNEIKEIFIAVLSNERVSIAVEIEYIEGKISLKEPVSKLPRLFCDFPLIGSEDFNIPFVINSSLFNPTEPRNGIFLSDKSDEKIVENKILILEARDLFIKLLDYASRNNWQKMYVLADVSLPKAKDWISKDWISEKFIAPLRLKLLTTPIIDNELYGRIPIECGGFNNIPDGARVDFPKHSKKEILSKLWEIFNNPYFILPQESNYQQWSKIIWDNKYVCNLASIVKLIEVKANITTLSTAIQKSHKDTIDWLNLFYILLAEEGEYIKEISQNAIYPNQNGDFKRKEELYQEVNVIPEILKDILRDLGDDFRDQLADKSIKIELPTNNSCTSTTVANQISKLLRPRLAEITRSNETRQIFKTLYLWFSQNKQEAEDIFNDLYKNKHKLLDDTEIVLSLEKAEKLDEFLKVEPGLSIERIQELLEIEALSKGLIVDKDYNPEERQKIINFENGWKGEAFVYKMLISNGLNVNWPNKSLTTTLNQITDFEGEIHFIEDKMQKYDLAIILPDNKKSYIQVKSTTTDITRADEIAMPISVREWNFIKEKQTDEMYYIARVFNVTSSPEVYFMKVEKFEKII